MPAWTFYPVFVGTIVSMAGLGRIAVTTHDAAAPKALSELAAAEERLLARFRNILLLCGTLFAITVFGFIVPRLAHGSLVAVFGALMIGGELLAAVVPFRGKTLRPHLLLAHTMGIGMLGLGVSFWVALGGHFAALEAILALSMAACALLTVVDKQHYIVYELAFIFSSHLSIVIAALALT
ncbi:MAG TPA: hypothetical protein VLF69_01400 [Candidatus Saccharimonadales bacterium]|nr:hypothetical protein [Candidatus Saccharimonadales bacterium]